MGTRLLFGLGNPGKRYAATRHNVGWQVLQALAAAEGAGWRASGFFEGEEAQVRLGDVTLRLVLPTTFMNLCGPAYARAAQVHDLAPEHALVVLDDFMLPFGRLRLREGGSSGGHNGLKSIEAALGSQAYPRLRVGIGPVLPPQRDPAGFVLEPYDAAQRADLPGVLARAADAVRVWAREGFAAAANRFNSVPEAPGPAPGA
jgi:peptidyl-tRNA hydrolase, PTH1 family